MASLSAYGGAFGIRAGNLYKERLNVREAGDHADSVVPGPMPWTRGPARAAEVASAASGTPATAKRLELGGRTAMSQENDSEDLTEAEAALLLRMTPSTLERWAKAGRIPSTVTANGQRMFRRSDIYGGDR